MRTLSHFHEVIDLWPSKAALASDLKTFGRRGGKTPVVRDWSVKDSIPTAWFDDVISAAQARGFDEVTYRLLSDLYKTRWPEKANPPPIAEAI